MEKIAVRDDNQASSADLAAAYTKITSAMVELVPGSKLYWKYHVATRIEELTTVDEPLRNLPLPLLPRPWIFESITAWLGGAERTPLLVVGAPGSGKSTIASQLIRNVREDSPARRVENLFLLMFARATHRMRSVW